MLVIDYKKTKYSWITQSGLIEPTSCWLLYAHAMPNGAVAGYIRLYDGHNTQGRQFAAVRTGANIPKLLKPPIPIYLETGLYVECVSALDGVAVLTCPVE